LLRFVKLQANRFTLKAQYDLDCVESAVKYQPTNQVNWLISMACSAIILDF